MFVATRCDEKDWMDQTEKFVKSATLAMGSSETARHLEVFNVNRDLGGVLKLIRKSNKNKVWDWVDT